MVGHGGSSAGSYLADPTSPIPSHCASIIVTSTLRVKMYKKYTSIREKKILLLFSAPYLLDCFVRISAHSSECPVHITRVKQQGQALF